MFKKLKTTVTRKVNKLKYQEYIQVLKNYNERLSERCEQIKLPAQMEYDTLDVDSVYKLECLVHQTWNKFAEKSEISGVPKLKSESKDVFAKVVKINAESASGSVAKLSMVLKKYRYDLFVVKYLQNEITEHILHELIVGLLLNTLRSSTPVFMYSFGGFFCSNSLAVSDAKDQEKLKKMTPEEKKAFLSRQTKKGVLCDGTSEDKLMIVNERIHGKSLTDWIASICDVNEIIKAFVHIAFALKFAQQKFKFGHNDLHANNIMIEEYDEPVEWKYKVQGPQGKSKKVVIRTRYMPKIIDYGMSRINTEMLEKDTAYFRQKNDKKERSRTLSTMSLLAFDLCKAMLSSGSVLCLKDENKNYCPLYDLMRLWIGIFISLAKTKKIDQEEFERFRCITDTLFTLDYNSPWMNHICQQYITYINNGISLFRWCMEVFWPIIDEKGSENGSWHPNALNNKEIFNTADARKIVQNLFYNKKLGWNDELLALLETDKDGVTCGSRSSIEHAEDTEIVNMKTFLKKSYTRSY